MLTAYCDEVEPDGAMGMHEGALGDSKQRRIVPTIGRERRSIERAGQLGQHHCTIRCDMMIKTVV
jgi:hypothetical protein